MPWPLPRRRWHWRPRGASDRASSLWTSSLQAVPPSLGGLAAAARLRPPVRVSRGRTPMRHPGSAEVMRRRYSGRPAERSRTSRSTRSQAKTCRPPPDPSTSACQAPRLLIFDVERNQVASRRQAARIEPARSTMRPRASRPCAAPSPRDHAPPIYDHDAIEEPARRADVDYPSSVGAALSNSGLDHRLTSARMIGIVLADTVVRAAAKPARYLGSRAGRQWSPPAVKAARQRPRCACSTSTGSIRNRGDRIDLWVRAPDRGRGGVN